MVGTDHFVKIRFIAKARKKNILCLTKPHN